MDPKRLFDNPDLNFFCAPNIEGQTFERKFKREPKLLAATLCGFANAQGGLLVIGITDDLKLQGVNELGEECIAKMVGAVEQVDTLVNHRFVDIINHKGKPDRLILMYVDPVTDRVVFRSDKEAFMRRGDRTVKLTPQEIFQLMQQRSGQPAEDRPIIPYNECPLDTEVFNWLMERASETLEVRQDPLEFLRNLGLIVDEDGKPYLTVAGYLLLARNPRQLIPGAYVRFLKYEGTEQRVGTQQNLVKDETFWGPVPKIVLRLRDFIPSQVREFTYLAPDGQFRTEPEYPTDVWDEAIVNAIFHRSYGNGFREEPIFVRMFEDRMEVLSPGPFPEGIGPGRFRHKPRNPHLMNAMRYFRKVQMIGEGTKRMYQEMADLGLPEPEFYEPGNHCVLVILRNDIERRKARRGVRLPEISTQFANLFPLEIKAPSFVDVDQLFPDEQLSPPSFREIKRALVQTLRDKGYLVDSFTQDTAVDFRQERVYEQLRQSKLVAIYPGFRFRIMTFDSMLYLCLDHTVEVRNRASLDRILGLCPHFRDRILGKGFVRTDSGWQPCRIRRILDGGQVEVSLGNQDREKRETYPWSAVVPRLKTIYIAELLARAGVRFDLHTEVKRLALSLAENAPRERARRTIQIAETLARTVFPIRVRDYEINLSTVPARLSSPQFATHSNLLETEPIFYRDLPESIILEGLTKHGAFERPNRELPLCALCTHQAWPQFEDLIQRIKKGSMRYQGFERTFGLRLGVPVALLAEKPEHYIEKLNQVLPTIKPGTFFLVYTPEEGYSRADYRSPYYQVKRLLLEQGFPSQMVDTDTLRDPRFKDLNLALNIFAKAGFVPWVLAEGMPNADLFVGLSYSSIPVDGRLQRLMAFANVFDEFGRWQYYQGNYQEIPFDQRNSLFRELLRKIIAEYQVHQQLRHLHIHVPFKLSHSDRVEIASGVREIVPEAEISFVYINRHTLIRAYDERAEGDGSLPRGTYIVTRPNQFWIATTGANMFREKVRGTPRILEVTVNRLNARTPLDLRIYAQHILSLTKLNWASSRSFCHEPITIKYASDIAYLMNAFISGFGTFRLHPTLERTPWFL